MGNKNSRPSPPPESVTQRNQRLAREQEERDIAWRDQQAKEAREAQWRQEAVIEQARKDQRAREDC